MKRFNMKMPLVLCDFLASEAERTGRTMSDIIRQCIENRPEFATYEKDREVAEQMGITVEQLRAIPKRSQ